MARTIQEVVTQEAQVISNRSWRVEVFCDKDLSAYEAVFHREQVMQVGSGPKALIKQLPAVRRVLTPEVLAQEITAGGVTITIAQLAALVTAAGDMWEEETEA
jgi:hypothetical protein